MKVVILDISNTCTCDGCLLYKLDIEFGRLFDGKAEIFMWWELGVVHYPKTKGDCHFGEGYCPPCWIRLETKNGDGK